MDPTLVFKFKMDQRLQCLKCNRVRYRKEPTSMISLSIPIINSGNLLENGKPEYVPVPFENVLERYFSMDVREFQCPFDNSKNEAGL